MAGLPKSIAVLVVSGALLLAAIGVPGGVPDAPRYAKALPNIQPALRPPGRDARPQTFETGARVSVDAVLPATSTGPVASADHLWADLAGPDRARRAGALRALARQRAEGFEKAVAKALAAPEWEMREAALGIAGEVRLPSLAGPLRALLGHPNRSTRLAACAALLVLGDDRALPVLESILLREDGLLRFEAARILVRRIPDRGAEAVAEAYRDLDLSRRRVAISRLGRNCPRGLSAFLESLLESPRPWERAGAAEALANVRPDDGRSK